MLHIPTKQNKMNLRSGKMQNFAKTEKLKKEISNLEQQ